MDSVLIAFALAAMSRMMVSAVGPSFETKDFSKGDTVGLAG
jgi:hypothetical protein